MTTSDNNLLVFLPSYPTNIGPFLKKTPNTWEILETKSRSKSTFNMNLIPLVPKSLEFLRADHQKA